MNRHLLTMAMAVGLGLSLSACTVVYERPNHYTRVADRNLIASIVPDRGEGSQYRVGDEVRIRVNVRQAGYLTLVARQPDGSAQVLARDVYVPAGTTQFPRPQDQVRYNVSYPTGLQVVRAIFSTERRPTTDLVIGGVYNEARWNTVGYDGVTPYDQRQRDVQETYFYIR